MNATLSGISAALSGMKGGGSSLKDMMRGIKEYQGYFKTAHGLVGLVEMMVRSGLDRAKEDEQLEFFQSVEDCRHIAIAGSTKTERFYFARDSTGAFPGVTFKVRYPKKEIAKTYDARNWLNLETTFWHPDRYYNPASPVQWMQREGDAYPLEHPIAEGSKSGGYDKAERSTKNGGYIREYGWCRYCCEGLSQYGGFSCQPPATLPWSSIRRN